jgi:hypothetical protein
MAAAAKEEDRSAGAALPGKDSKMAQDSALQEAAAVDPHGNRGFAGGAYHFTRRRHGSRPSKESTTVPMGSREDSTLSRPVWDRCEGARFHWH